MKVAERIGFLSLSLSFSSSLSLFQESLPQVKKARGDVPDPLPEPELEPTGPASDFENSYNYVSACPHSFLVQVENRQ